MISVGVPEAVKCPTCVEAGQRSCVRLIRGLATHEQCWGPDLYFDEDGVGHHHDLSGRSTAYECENGHRWTVERYPRCPAEGCEFNVHVKPGEVKKWKDGPTFRIPRETAR